MTFTKTDVARKLREYPSLMRIKQQLEFELSLPMIEDWSAHASKEHRNQAHQSELTALLFPVVTELRRMDYYIELLPKEVGAVLRTLYVEGLTYRDAATKLMVDVKSITNRKNQGLSELAAMYSRLPAG